MLGVQRIWPVMGNQPDKTALRHWWQMKVRYYQPNKSTILMLTKVKLKDNFYLENIFEFRKTFKKVNKNLGFHLMLKTNDLQDIIYTSMDDDIKVTIKNLYL